MITNSWTVDQRSRLWLALIFATLLACVASMSISLSATAQGGQTCVFTQDAHARSGPGTGFASYGVQKAGWIVYIYETNPAGTWGHHKRGWSAMKLLNCSGNQQGNQPATGTDATSTSGWSITWYPGATAQMRGQGANPWPSFPQLNPTAWPEFPNVANPSQGFPASYGLEFGEDESQFCGSSGDQCEIVVPPRSYALITGDWALDAGLGGCNGASLKVGCSVMLINVGEVSAEFHGMLNNVYVVQGRYWHGDFLPIAINAGLSHATNNMTHQNSILNPTGSANAGGNCSLATGCDGVNNQFKITSGNELEVSGETTWYR